MLFASMCAAVLVGTAVAQERALTDKVLLLTLILLVAATAISWPLVWTRLPLVAIVAGLLAALRVTLAPSPQTDALAPYVDQRVTLLAQVQRTPELRTSSMRFVLEVAEALAPRGPVLLGSIPPRVEVISPASGVAPRLAAGDWLRVEGTLRAIASPAAFPRAEILGRQGIYTSLVFPRLTIERRGPPPLPSTFEPWRAGVESGFRRYLPEPQASLAYGMLLGGSSRLDQELRQGLQATGLGHLVAVSGANIVIVAAAVQWLFVRTVGRRWAPLPVLLAILAYTLAVGAPPSAVRAAIMASAAVCAQSLGRIADPLTAVLSAAALMALWDPGVVADVGFRLSVAATLGLVLLAPRFAGLLPWAPAWLREPASLALAATAATIPVALPVFGQTSLVGPLANLLAAPLVPLTMLAAALMALALPIEPVAEAVAPLAWAPTTLFVALVQAGAAIPGAQVWVGTVPPAVAGLLGAALVTWGLWPLAELAPFRATACAVAVWLRRRPLAAILAPTVLVAGILAAGAAAAEPRPTRIAVLHAGGGSATFIRAANGATALVSGPEMDPVGLARLMASQLDAFERTIDVVVVLDERHRDGLAEVLRRYSAGTELAPGVEARLLLGEATLDVASDAVSLVVGSVYVVVQGTAAPDALLAASAYVALRPEGISEIVAPILAVGRPIPTLTSTEWLAPPHESALVLETDGAAVWPPLELPAVLATSK